MSTSMIDGNVNYNDCSLFKAPNESGFSLGCSSWGRTVL